MPLSDSLADASSVGRVSDSPADSVLEVVPDDFEDNEDYEEAVLDDDAPGARIDRLPLAKRAANPMGL